MAKPFSLRPELDALQGINRYRRRRIVASPQGPVIRVDGREMLAFCSNDYLGLANDSRVKSAFIEAARKYGVGSGASHLVTGHHALHEALEERLAAFTGRQRAILFSSGYAANLGVITALMGRSDVLLQDKLNHASLIDAGQLCAGKVERYHHADAGALRQRLLAVNENARCLVATDAVFSMDGDLAPIREMAALCSEHAAWLMVDDAHGFGVLGERGAGSLEMLECNDQVPVYMATLGKALGVGGAFVAGTSDLVEFLLQKARTGIYTTALPPAMAAATLAALDIVETEVWRRQHLGALIARFRAGAERLSLPLMASSTPIQPVILGSDVHAVAASETLLSRGILVSAIRPPTVPENTARLRITLSAAHSEQHVDALLDALSCLNIDDEESL